MTLPIPLGEHDLPFLKEKRKLPADDIPSGTYTLPIIHARRPKLSSRAIEIQVENRSDVSYYAQLNIGTPPQTVYAQIDTGSFELWVNPNCSNVQSADQRFCRAIGFYDPSSSSTADVTSQSARLRYGIGSADVTYVRDSIALPNAGPAESMRAVQFGVADTSVDEFSGILGLGAGNGFNTDYPNFVDELAAQGITNTKAFSLALGSKAEEEGVLIFGGVDTSKFRGELAHLPIVPADDSPDGVARYWVKMDSISLTPPSSSSSSSSSSTDAKPTAFPQTSMTVFLDSGSTLTLLPPALVRQIASALGSTQTDDNGFFVVDCALAGQDGTIDFAFDGVTIRVPYAEMIRQVSSLPPHCYLGMMGSTEFALLGDTFLRSAYAVFDLTSNIVHLAPYVNCGTSIKSITSTSSLSNLVGTCDNDSSKAPSSPSPSPSPTTQKAISKPTSKSPVSPPAASTPASSSPATTVNIPSPTSAAGTPTAVPSKGAATTTPAAAAATRSSSSGGAQSSAATTTGAAASQSSGTSGAGRKGVRGFALSVVFAAMGYLMI
ncbi:acid protease [Trichoderma citrinoviride]|uniref:Acid protease n=1 Tax=Trichoderma citrinoviride TaxID=58853 RepID=A0A2T4B6U2_9HYPO|nr:acid protease [Trichoderma citrinoviride]PTB65056.1 acid protease [Trichoderma citrinoviride]